MFHSWRTMIWDLFKKSGSLDSNQKHRRAAENNPSSVVFGFCSARSRGTCDKCVSSSLIPSRICVLLLVMWQACFPGPIFLLLTPLKWERQQRTRTVQQTVAERERNPQGRLPFLQRHHERPSPASASRVRQLSSCCPGQSSCSFPACRWTPSPKCIYFLIFHRRSSSFCVSSHDAQHEWEPAPTYPTGLLSVASPVSLQQIWCFQAFFSVLFLPPAGLDLRDSGFSCSWMMTSD